jgi:hypothetical protein
MARRTTIAILVLALIGLTGAPAAQDIRKVQKTITADGADRISVEWEFGAGRVIVEPEDMAEVAKIEISYDADLVSYDVAYDVRREIGHLSMSTEFEDHIRDGDTENRWDVALSTRYPAELYIEMGACDAAMDLGGIPIVDARFDIGAASGEIDFSKPNPSRIKDFEIKIGASSLTVDRLGNANFDQLKFEGGVASCELDFSGEYHGESVAYIEVGLGSADITVPRGLAIRIESDGENWFSSVDFDDLDLQKAGRNAWESDNFEASENRLVLVLDVGMGSVDITYGR